MFWVELILVLAIIFLGVRKGGTFLAMAGGVGGRTDPRLQLAPRIWLQCGRHALGHFHGQHPRLDLGAAGVCGHALRAAHPSSLWPVTRQGNIQ